MCCLIRGLSGVFFKRHHYFIVVPFSFSKKSGIMFVDKKLFKKNKMNTKENLARGEKKVGLNVGAQYTKRKKVVVSLLLLNVLIFVGLISIAKSSYQVAREIGYNQPAKVKAPTATVIAPGEVDLGSTFSSAPAMLKCGDQDQFIVPADAAENGELSIGVVGLDGARKRVTELAGEGGGLVYSTNLNYAAGSLKRGTMVVQVPADKFEKTFEALKAVGTQLLRESTQKISSNNFGCPVPMTQGAGVEVKSVTTETQEADNADKTVTAGGAGTDTIAVSPTCLYPQTSQDKAYIKVTFVDNKKEVVAKNNLTIGKSLQDQQAYRNRAWLAFLIKIIFVILLVIFLIALVIRAFRLARHARRERKNKLASGVTTRQLIKSRKVIVKTKKK